MKQIVKKMIEGDLIKDLPNTTNTDPTFEELKIIQMLFPEERKNKLNLKVILLVGLLFIIFSLEPLNKILHIIIPITVNSPYILIVIKAIAVMVIYWFCSNFLIKT